MTWYWGFVDKATIKVESPSGDVTTLNWGDYDSDYTEGNGWTWDSDPPSGDRPKPVYDTVVQNDVQAALMDDIEQNDSRFDNLPAN